MIDKWIELVTKERALIGLSFTRIFFAIAILYELVINFPARQLLWGPEGLYPYTDYQTYVREDGFYTLFDISSSSLWVDFLFIGGIIVAICYLIGYQTRIMGILLAILMFSIYFRNPEITHGGDNILRILLIYLIFARVNAHFSIDAYREKQLKDKPKKSLYAFFKENPSWLAVRAVFHNFAWFACILQVAFLYFSSGTYKIMGQMWQEGTALYYASRVQDFYNPYFTEWLWKFEPVIILLSYFTVLFQVSFPFMLLNRYTKYIAILSACSLHAGIAFLMGLADFSWIMIGCELMLLLDHEYKTIYQFITKWRKRPTIERKQAA